MDYANVDIVDKAENVINKDMDPKDLPTTTQMRKFLAAVNVLENKVNACKTQGRELDADTKGEISFLRARLYYQCARNEKVKKFSEKAELEEWIKYACAGVNEFLRFARFMEALIAFRKYLGGDN